MSDTLNGVRADIYLDTPRVAGGSLLWPVSSLSLIKNFTRTPHLLSGSSLNSPSSVYPISGILWYQGSRFAVRSSSQRFTMSGHHSTVSDPALSTDGSSHNERIRQEMLEEYNDLVDRAQLLTGLDGDPVRLRQLRNDITVFLASTSPVCVFDSYAPTRISVELT